MHIPDGFLDARICIGTAAVSAGAVGAALGRVRPEAEPGLTPRMGLTAAYVFGAQMVNFPVAGGTSGHLLGALLAAVLLGPQAATVVMAAVFIIQTLFFLDGGHTALGANILNMGLAGTYGGYAVYRALAGPAPTRGRFLRAAGIAAWFSVMLGAALTSAELALSGAAAPGRVFPAMLGVHALIGAGEAAITVAALGLLWRVRPDLVTGRDGGASAGSRWGWTAAAGLVVLAVLAPFASPAPDGLERVAETLGFHSRSTEPAMPGPFPDYTLRPFGEAPWVPALVSLLGAVLMLAAVAAVIAGRSGVQALGRFAPHRAQGIGHGEAGPSALSPNTPTPQHPNARMPERLNASSTALTPSPPHRVTPSPLARLDPRVKLGCALGLVLAAVFLPPAEAGKLWMLFGLAALWALVSQVSARWLATRALFLLPFVGLAALSLPHARGQEGIELSFYGLAFLRAGTSLLATAAFLGTTPEPDALSALSAYRLPRPLGQTIAFALRYLRVMGAEVARMLQARAARAAGAGTLALRAQGTGGIVGSLFIRSMERSERISQAMAARGYWGDLPRTEIRRLSGADWSFAAGWLLFLLGVCLWP
jgi:cobalt/nickel transport system permease protein